MGLEARVAQLPQIPNGFGLLPPPPPPLPSDSVSVSVPVPVPVPAPSKMTSVSTSSSSSSSSSSASAASSSIPLPLHLQKQRQQQQQEEQQRLLQQQRQQQEELNRTTAGGGGVNPFASSQIMSPARPPKATASAASLLTTPTPTPTPTAPPPSSTSLPSKPVPLHLQKVATPTPTPTPPPAPEFEYESTTPGGPAANGPGGFFVVGKRKPLKGDPTEGDGTMLDDLDRLLEKTAPAPAPPSSFFIVGKPVPTHFSSTTPAPTPGPPLPSSAGSSLLVPPPPPPALQAVGKKGSSITPASVLPSSSLSNNMKPPPPSSLPPSALAKPPPPPQQASKPPAKTKTPKQPELRGGFKNRTTEFQQLRSGHRQKGEEDINQMLTNLAKLSLLQLELEGNKGGKGSKGGIVTPTPKRKLDKCARCGSQFDWSWLKLREVRNVCYLCRDVFCDACGTASIDLHTVNASEDKPAQEVRVCLSCQEVVSTYYRRINWEELKRQTELNPIVNYYRDTSALRSQVLQLIDRYVEIVSTLSRIEEERFRKANEQLAEAIGVSSPLEEPTASLTSASSFLNMFKSLFSSSASSSLLAPPATPLGSSSAPTSSVSSSAVHTPVVPGTSSAPPSSRSAYSLAVKPPSMPSEIKLSTPAEEAGSESPEQLYEAAAALEKEIVKSMNTYVQGVKLLSEIVVDSPQEEEVIKHVKKAAIENITENALSQKNMKRLLVQIETKKLEKVYVTLLQLCRDLSNYPFNGVLRNPIEKCLDSVKEDLKFKLGSIGEKWEQKEADLNQTVDEELNQLGGESRSMMGLPLNSPVKRQAEKVRGVVNQLSNMLNHSIAHQYLEDSINALSKLSEEIQEYT